MAPPKISVITVSYNQGEFIRQNIESVLAQNYENFEHIVVDGGSTDSTIEVLKSYPHLKWTSAPDRGQSDALNQGFARAQGEIIAWLNSDDWYAPNIFHDVAAALSEYPVVIGAAEQTDRSGKTTEVVPNTERSYFDLWRYWIPYAWMAQPSVFFRKTLLEKVKRADGTYIDEDLYFSMDFDLWMRMAAHFPFTKRINKTLSYFRIYDQNKTGARPLATQRECARVFRRYRNRLDPVDQSISFVIPVAQPTEDLKKTVLSIVNQSQRDFDILLVDYAADKAASKNVHEFSLDLSEVVEHTTTRYVKALSPNAISALNTGIDRACAPLISILSPGDTVNPDFVLTANNIFSRDVVGIALPQLGNLHLESKLYPDANTLNIAALFSLPFFYPNFVVRRLACVEVCGISENTNPALALKEFLFKVIYRGWAFHCDSTLSVTQKPRSYTKVDTFIESNQTQIVSWIVSQLKKSYHSDPFAPVRGRVRDVTSIFNILGKDPDEILAQFPAGWDALDLNLNGD